MKSCIEAGAKTLNGVKDAHADCVACEREAESYVVPKQITIGTAADLWESRLWLADRAKFTQAAHIFCSPLIIQAMGALTVNVLCRAGSFRGSDICQAAFANFFCAPVYAIARCCTSLHITFSSSEFLAKTGCMLLPSALRQKTKNKQQTTDY